MKSNLYMSYYEKYIKYKNKYLLLKQMSTLDGMSGMSNGMSGGKNTTNSIKIKPIHTINNTEIIKLADITSNPETMRTIGKGTVWDVKYIRDLVKYSRMDITVPNPQYYHFIIKKNNDVVGYVGIHPMIAPYRGELQLRYIISPDYRGQGIATIAVKEIINTLRKKLIGYNKRIWSVNADKNIPANKVSINTGLKFITQLPIDNELYNYYEFIL